MNKFRTTDIRYRIEDQLNWMLLTSYEIEMHLNAVLFLANIDIEYGPLGRNHNLLWINHDDLAIIKTASLLKRSTKSDERASLMELSNFLQGNGISIRNNYLKSILAEIKDFYDKYSHIDKFTNRRNTAAHKFKTNKEISTVNANSVDFRTHLKVVLEAREILQKLRIKLLGEAFENDSIDLRLFEKIYSNSLEIILKQP